MTRNHSLPANNQMLRRHTLLTFTLMFIAASALSAEEAAPFQAGVARVELTPPLEMKVALGGYGARMSKPAVGVHDAVCAKAIVFTQGERRFALVTADVLAFPPQFKAAVVNQLTTEGWSADQIMLLPSHTHTSFDMMALHVGNTFGIPQVGLFHKELFTFTVERLAKVIHEANQKLEPAAVASGVVVIPNRNRNRRGLAAHDSDLTVTRVDSLKGRPLAALVNWTAHPTFMDESDMLFSGDWPGHLQRTLEALVGEGMTALFYNGAEGDQSPIPPAGAASNWERAERYGREMGIHAWRCWEKLEAHVVKDFVYHTEKFSLPRRTWHQDFMKTGGAEYGLSESMMQAFVNQLVPAESHATCLRVGDLLVVGVPGELAAELGFEIKKRAHQMAGAKAATIGGLADEWISYVLPAAEYRKGGYEASVSFYGETLGNSIVEVLTQGLRHLATRTGERVAE